MTAKIKIVFILLFISGFLFVTNKVEAQVPDEIIQSLKSGNSKTLSEYFNQNIEMVINSGMEALESDGVYSKAQAQQIVNNFFKFHSPERFTIIHQGGKESAQYVIGSLETSTGQFRNFRVYFLLKKNNGKDYIHQLRIEKQ